MHLFKKLLSKLKPSYLEFEEALPESPEEFKSAHHQIVLKEISKYEDVDLNNLSDSQIKKIAKEIAMIIATSLLKYPNTAECDTEVLEINRVLIKDHRFQLYIEDYIRSRYYNKLMNQGTPIEAFYRYEMIRFLELCYPNQLTPGARLFFSIRQGTTPASYLTDVLKL